MRNSEIILVSSVDVAPEMELQTYTLLLLKVWKIILQNIILINTCLILLPVDMLAQEYS